MGSIERTYVNLVCSVLVLFANVVVSLFLSPYIVSTIGVEANGFVTLANNFVMYAQLAVTALNSMAARFITIAYVNKDYKKANLFYNSAFWGNVVLVAIFIIPAVICIAKLECIVDLPQDIEIDVKMLFSFVFASFFVSTLAPKWECGTYVTNRLDRLYVPQTFFTVFQYFVLFLLFAFLVPKVWYVGAAALLYTVAMLVVNAINTHRLTPKLRIKLKKKRLFSFKATKELVFSGIWNTISSIGTMLLSGLDLLVCNIFLGSTAMGILSLAKILPLFMQELAGSICRAFAPELTINYALGAREKLLSDLKRAMTITSVILTIPVAGIIVIGDKFFALWLPSQDAQLLWILAILSIIGYAFTSGTQILYSVFTTVNKVKQNSIAVLISGVVSLVVTVFFVQDPMVGIFAVAGVSSIVNLIRNMTYTVPATAKYLGLKITQFFPDVGVSFAATFVLVIVFSCFKLFLPFGNWLEFVISVLVLALVGLLTNSFLILKKQERMYLFTLLRNITKRH